MSTPSSSNLNQRINELETKFQERIVKLENAVVHLEKSLYGRLVHATEEAESRE